MKNSLPKLLLVTTFVILGIVNLSAQAPPFNWADRAGGSDIDQALGVATDASGNVYAVGTYASTSITFGSTTLTRTGNSSDGYLVKYNSSGVVQWAVNMGSTFSTIPHAVATDASGNVFVTGTFTSISMSFGAYTLTNSNPTGGYGDIFLVKYDANGNVLWAKQATGVTGNKGSEESYSVATDASGNAFITGIFRGATLDFEGMAVLYNANSSLPSFGQPDVFIAKYAGDGTFQWAQSAGGTSNDYAKSVAADAGGNAIITGYFTSTDFSFDGGGTSISPAGSDDIFVAKYDGATGSTTWANRYGGTGTDKGVGITTDGNSNIYVTGDFTSFTFAFGATTLTLTGSYDMYLAKFNSSGTPQWAKSAGTFSSFTYGLDLVTDAGNNVYLTASYTGASITVGSTTLTNTDNSGTFDNCTIKYDAAGNVLWVKGAGGPKNDKVQEIAVDATGRVSIAGSFDGSSVTFGSYTLTNNTINYDDFFVAQLAANAPSCTAPNGTVAFGAFSGVTTSATTTNVTYTNGSNAANGYVLLRSTTNTAPTAPASGTAVPSAGSSVTWGGTYTVVNSTTTLGSSVPFNSTGLSASTTYYYWVVAYQNTNGPCWFTPGTQANNSQATSALSCTAPNGTVAFGAFSGVTTSATTTNVTYTNGGNAASGYVLLRSTTNTAPTAPASGTAVPSTGSSVTWGGTYTVVNSTTTLGSSVPFNSTGLSASTTYYYWVVAYQNTNGPCWFTPGTQANNSQATSTPICTAPNGTVAFSAFTGVTASATTTNVTYTNGGNPASGYVLLRSSTNTAPTAPASGTAVPSAGSSVTWGGTYTVVNSTTTLGSSVPFNSTGLSASTTYYYWVVAYQNTNGPCWFTPGTQANNSQATLAATAATALNFDGVDDQVNISNSTVFNMSSGTIEAWFKTNDAGGGFRGIVVKEYYYGIFLLNNQIYVHNWSGGASFTSAGTYNDGNWHHVAFVFNNGISNGSKVFIDGVAQTAFTYDAGTPTTTTLTIGNNNANPQNFNGTIDEVRIWNKALCDGDIINQRNCELGGTLSSDLLAYYKFNQGTDAGNNTAITTLTDSKSTYPGTFSGISLTGSTSNFISGGSTPTGVTCTYAPLTATATNTGAYCAGTTISVSASPSGGTPTYTYSWASNAGGSYTANGNPATRPSSTTAMSGAYNVTVTDASSCTASASTSVTVNAGPTANAGSALAAICQSGTSAQMGGSVGGSATGGTWSGGAGTWTNASNPATATYTAGASESGTITLTLTTSGGSCGTTTATKTITVNANPTANAGGGLGSICQNGGTTAAMGGSVGGGATGGTWTGGAGNWTNANNPSTATYTAGVSESGSILLTLTTSGGSCGTTSASKSITVNVTNSAGAASSTPTLCINTPLTNITHSTTGATGIGTATGLPAGVTAAWAGNTITISGTPTASGTFNYTIPLTGGCGIVNATGTITVTAANTVGAASGTPTLCINTLLTNITHTTTGATGIGTATGLPAGVTAAWASNTITISGTPTASGTFNYTIPLTGGCGTATATGSITVTPNKTVSAASSTPSVCINTAITNITHTTTGATGIGTATGLPAGVTAAWVSNTITISGTPTASGTFNYSIPLTGGCGNINATGTITVVTANSAGAASSTPTLCINTAITNITHTTTGATGIGTATGLPAGVTATWASNTITISGTPTASGTFNYTIPLTGGCGTATATGSITVTPNKTVSAASSTPSVCINTAITNITHTTTGATGIGAATGLPAGVTATWASNTITISGTPTAAGTFNYTIPLTGGCGTVNATGTITVSPDNTIPSESNTFQFVCINAAINTITHTTTGATGIGTPTGLPAGVTATWASNTITISGTPTVSGPFNYTIPLTGGCGTVNATGFIGVVPVYTVSAASSTPTLCINTAITPNITHTTTDATGIGTPTGLPAGVTAAWANNVITISGTPTTSGIFNYSIPITGCGTGNATGTITVNSNTVTAASSTPTLCINTAITNITHTTTGATGIGTTTGLPAGVTAAWASNTITISGTPTASGTFNYTIPLTGGCGTLNATGTITVTPNKTVTAASSTPTLCINTALTNITHTTTGATGIGTATGLPAGVTAAWASNTITISGTPTASGTFNYTIPLTGGCGTVNATGTITITTANTVSTASSTPAVCINTALTPITHTTTGATGIGTATGLPAGVTAAWASNTITISGTPTASGTFNYTIPLTGGCGTVNATGTITVNSNTVTAASSTPTLCSNTALANITHTTTGATGIGTATGLPAGVTAAWASNTITISGTPTASGTFNYSIPLTGGCGTLNATGTITVTTANTVGAASSTPSVCINTALANITHTTTGATGIGTATGLPAGVTAAWASNTITISGTPTASGTFNYTIPLTGGCGTVNATGTITVTTANSASAASTTPTLCINTPLSNITHTTTGATGIGTATGLPAGVTAAWASNTITISGTPTASGTFNYTIPLTGGCGTVNATGIITVTPNHTVSAASTTPTLCINTAIANITHTTTGATGIGAATGLPAGVTAAWASNTITISGTPTASGTFNYTIPLTGGCGTVNATGTITVNVPPAALVIGPITQPTCATATGRVEICNMPAPSQWIVTANPGGAVIGGNIGTCGFVNLAPNTYTFTVTLVGVGCPSAPSASVTINPQPVTPTAPVTGTITQPTCATATGSVDLTGLPASGSWTLTQNPGAVTSTGTGTATTVSGLAGGTTYSWVVTNAAGCVSATSTSVTINTQPVTPAAPVVSSVTQPTCLTATGSVVLSGLPSPGPWTVTATPGNITQPGITSTATISGLAAGSYTFTVNNGTCTSGPSAIATINPQTTPTPILYVDSAIATPGNGGSWATAYKELSAALKTAHECSNVTRILVAKGTYLPAYKPFNNGTEISTADNRDWTFHLRSNLAVYGGYPTGGGTRNIAANPTILSGNIGTANDSTDNTYHVVLIANANTTDIDTLDGFTITGSNSQTTSSTIYYLTLNGLTVLNRYGGGIAAYGGTTTISNNTLSGNTASYAAGIYTNSGINIVSNNTLRGNTAYVGGGIYTQGGINTISNNTISNNTASGGYSINEGGGIFANLGTNTISNNTISTNTTSSVGLRALGGGIYTQWCANTISNNTISNNTASSTYNSADGAGIYTTNCTNTIINNTINNNTANSTYSSTGGGIYSSNTTNTIINNIFWNNKKQISNSVSGADYENSASTNTFKNNLLQLAQASYATANNNDLGSGASGNIFAQDPLFVDANDIDGPDNIHRTADDGLRLQPSSPCINEGITGTFIPATDILGNARVGATDMGAYESPVPVNPCPFAVLYVDSAIASPGNGGTWATAYKDLAFALKKAHQCSNVTQILVAKGTYLPAYKPFNNGTEISTTDNRDRTFHLRSNLAVYGGYPTGGGTRNIAANPTRLSGDIGTTADNTDNTYHVVLIANATEIDTLDGFIISGGNANGGAAVTFGSSTVNQGLGGGIFVKGGTNTISNNTISKNAAAVGGGVYTPGGTNTISNNTLSENTATDNGGGIYTLTNENIIVNNTLYLNTATNGGALYSSGGANTITNNIFWNNKKQTSNNVAGADYTGSFSSNTFRNNLLQLVQTSYAGDFLGSNFLGNAASGNLFNKDPLFVNATNPNVDAGLQLQDISPAIDAGITGSGIPATDKLGNARVGATDMGAYESPVPPNPCPFAVLYVDSAIASPGNGGTWATAYKELSDALKKAHQCPNVKQVLVSTGTYLPAYKPFNNGTEISTTDNRDRTFHLRSNLAVYGGYDATTGNRDVAANPTTLSGDIGTTAVNTDNTYHVVLIANATEIDTLDGFIISGGNANGGAAVTIGFSTVNQHLGGGIFVKGGTNTIRNNTISGNQAKTGGGINTSGGTNTISNNTISGNNASFFAGGIYTLSGTNTIRNNTISGNMAGKDGGGIANKDGTNSISNNTISGNNASLSAGGINTEDGTNSISNNTISGNQAKTGGGINTSGGTNTISNNTISGNNASLTAGGIYTIDGTNTISNNTISNNTVIGVVNYECIGGGITVYKGTNTISNNIFWNNKICGNANDAFADYANVIAINTFKNNLMQLPSNMYQSRTFIGKDNDLGSGAEGNIFAIDPQFVNANDVAGPDGIHRTDDDGLRLKPTSPVINKGITGTNIPVKDIAEHPRVGLPDLGAYEVQELVTVNEVIKISALLSPNGDGKNDVLTVETSLNQDNATWSIRDVEQKEVYKATGAVNWDGNSQSGDKVPKGEYTIFITMEGKSYAHTFTVKY